MFTNLLSKIQVCEKLGEGYYQTIALLRERRFV